MDPNDGRNELNEIGTDGRMHIIRGKRVENPVSPTATCRTCGTLLFGNPARYSAGRGGLTIYRASPDCLTCHLMSKADRLVIQMARREAQTGSDTASGNMGHDLPRHPIVLDTVVPTYRQTKVPAIQAIVAEHLNSMFNEMPYAECVTIEVRVSNAETYRSVLDRKGYNR